MNVETLFRVAALNTEYANCIDADRLEEWPGLFLEQCLYKITTADNHRRGYAAGLVRIVRDGRMDLFATGMYLDRVRDDGGTLRFAERIVVCDSSRIDTLLAIPL
jgi:3-phenylpropionate/cinnamic acid dioxygenase small subunit